MRRTHDRRPEDAGAAGDVDRRAHGLDGMRIFGTGVDIALGGAGGDAGDDHALDQNEGIALHDHPVGEGAAVALVGIADDIFAIARSIGNRLPFDAGRKARTAATAQAAVGHRLDDVGGAHGHGLFQTLKPFIVAIVGQRERIGHAATGKGQPRLAGEIGNFLRQALTERMLATTDEIGLEQARHVGDRHGSIGDAAVSGANLDKRFKPQEAAGTIAHDRHGDPTKPGFALDRRRHLVGTDGNRRGILGNIDRQAHRRASATSSSSPCSSSRPCSSPSSMAAGAQAQSPRQ
ncbi:hypothetical protein D3C72_1349670 [compost metagenome]